MTTTELESLIQQGEGYNLEFKQSVPSKASDIAKELCAFANANGGTLLIGVDDKGKIVGVNINNKIRSEIQQVISLLDPRLDINVSEPQLQNKTILCLECNDGPQKPYAVSSRPRAIGQNVVGKGNIMRSCGDPNGLRARRIR